MSFSENLWLYLWLGSTWLCIAYRSEFELSEQIKCPDHLYPKKPANNLGIFMNHFDVFFQTEIIMWFHRKLKFLNSYLGTSWLADDRNPRTRGKSWTFDIGFSSHIQLVVVYQKCKAGNEYLLSSSEKSFSEDVKV